MQAPKTGQLKGILAILALILSTSVFFIPVLFFGLLKLVPNTRWRILCMRIIDKAINHWSDVNSAYINYTQDIHWQIHGLEQLEANASYLVMANHQSWLDIVLLQHLFNRKIPVLKFFIKDQLKWVPLLGFSWWAMGSPFMKRYSKEYLLKYPHKKGKDLESTRKALRLFKKTPSSIMNFVEGTRFTSQKKTLQNSPYQHLLKPKAGGIRFVLSSMGEQIQSILDVTIVYPCKEHSLWDFLCQRVKSIVLDVRRIPIPTQFLKNELFDDEQTHHAFCEWLNTLWDEKDKLITHYKS